MRKVFLAGMFLLSGCAHYAWKKEEWSKTNLAEAHNTCLMKAGQAGYFGGSFAANLSRDRFIEECLNGQGFIKVRLDN